MTRSTLTSDLQTTERARFDLGSFAAHTFFRPSGAPAGGDRFGLREGGGGALEFFHADAAGHGAIGARFWTEHRTAFDRIWAGGGCPADLASDLNDALVGRSAHLCLTLGRWEPDGALEFGVFGYGNHAIVRTPVGPWRPAGRAIGLKLGWFESARWPPDARIVHRVPDARRIVLLCDGFLGDDHRDPPATLALVDSLAERVGDRPAPEVADIVLAAGCVSGDDLSLLVLDRVAP